MKNGTLKSQSGFSLVELMVVVAIIGILAAMSVGQIQKQIAKARQAEAKSNLAALYTAESTFRSEYNTFVSDFSIMKLDLTGRLRYRTGFTAMHVDDAAVAGFGYQGVNTNGDNDFATSDCGTGLANCTETAEANVSATATATTQTTFLATAGSYIYQNTGNAADVDSWSINENKTINQTVDGIQ